MVSVRLFSSQQAAPCRRRVATGGRVSRRARAMPSPRVEQSSAALPGGVGKAPRRNGEIYKQAAERAAILAPKKTSRSAYMPKCALFARPLYGTTSIYANRQHGSASGRGRGSAATASARCWQPARQRTRAAQCCVWRALPPAALFCSSAGSVAARAMPALSSRRGTRRNVSRRARLFRAIPRRNGRLRQ